MVAVENVRGRVYRLMAFDVDYDRRDWWARGVIEKPDVAQAPQHWRSGGILSPQVGDRFGDGFPGRGGEIS